MSTIRDIARKADVSASTASLALNGDTRVRSETRQRVLAAARALNYHPNRAARSLSSGLTYAIQLLNPVVDAALSSGFFTRFSHGVHDVGREHDYTVALTVLDDEREAQGVLSKLVNERWADGIILMNPTENAMLLEQLSHARFPHVLLGRSARHETLSVDNDNIMVAYDAARHLIERARTPILFLSGLAYHTFTQDRAQGYRLALSEAGYGPDEALLHFIEGSPRAARTHVRRLLSQGLRFASVLAVSDGLAVGAMRALRDEGLRIPGDVAVMGMNNDEITEYTDPQLTSVELNAYDLGREAANMLLNRVGGADPKKRRRIVPHRLIIRESS